MNAAVLLSLIEDSRTRLLLSLVVASTAFLALPLEGLEVRLLTAWDVGALCFLALVGLLMISANAARTCRCAQRQEVDHLAIFRLVVFATCTSLFAIGAELANHKDSFTPEVGLSVVAILSSWFLMHITFALHYATVYYRPIESESEEKFYQGGLEFSSGESPNYLDFLYFTFTLGMTSQTSDTAIVSSPFRRLVLAHTITSFFFYSVVLALSVSIISGLL